jgi:hypothetical protein
VKSGACTNRAWWHPEGVRFAGGLGVLLSGAASILMAGCHGSSLVPDNGRCGPTPKVLVSAGAYAGLFDAGSVDDTVRAILLDGSDLYVVLQPTSLGPKMTSGSPDGVLRVSTYGGSSVLLASGAFLEAPAFTPTSVIVGEEDGQVDPTNIVSIPRDGSAPAILASLPGTDTLFTPMVTDGTSVYFADNGGVESVPVVPAATPATPTTLVANQVPSTLAVFGQRLLMFFNDGEVDSLPIGADAGVTTQIGQASAAVQGSVVSCGAAACWLGTGEIDQIDPASGPATTVAVLTGAVASASGLAFDGTTFFVSGQSSPTATSSAIVSVPGGGGAQTVVATLPSSTAIAVDDACVYFSTSTGIFSLLKSAQGIVVP